MRGARVAGVLLLLVVLIGLGCVRREIEILSSPPGASVQFDGDVLAQKTPARFAFVWYGTHEIVVEKEGHHRERLTGHVRPPWYETFPIDFFAENVWPWTLSDIHTYPFTLEKEEPKTEASESEKQAMKKGLLERADQFRKEARLKLGTPPAEKTPEKPEKK